MSVYFTPDIVFTEVVSYCVFELCNSRNHCINLQNKILSFDRN